MKRHLISYDSDEKDELKQCPKTSLTILGSCQKMLGEDRDASESERHGCKRRKLESQQVQEETSTIKNEDNNDRKSKLRFLDLVSSAVTLLAEREKKREQMQSQEGQTQSEQICSEVSMASTTRGSRSNSIASEHSIYRSYEMELPDQPQNECMNNSILLRAPRFPTARDVPITQEIGCQLNSRRYGELPVFIDGNEEKSNETIQSCRLNKQFEIQTVIYR